MVVLEQQQQVQLLQLPNQQTKVPNLQTFLNDDDVLDVFFLAISSKIGVQGCDHALQWGFVQLEGDLLFVDLL